MLIFGKMKGSSASVQAVPLSAQVLLQRTSLPQQKPFPSPDSYQVGLGCMVRNISTSLKN